MIRNFQVPLLVKVAHLKKIGGQRATGLFFLIWSLLLVSCEPPFEGVTAILTNNQVDRIITLEVVDANTNAINPYPSNVTLRLSGVAIDQGLIYYSDGAPLGNNVFLVDNSVNLAVRPNTEILPDAPLQFNVVAEAEGYLSNALVVQLGANEKIKYVELGLVNLGDLPEGVTATTAASLDFEADAPVNDIVVPLEDFDDTVGEPLKARITYNAGTVFRDEQGNDLAGNQLSTQLTYFDGIVDQAILAATGGKGNAVLEDGSVAVLNGLVNVRAFLNGNAVRSFSTPVTIDIFFASGAFNPKTNQRYAVGDVVSVISRENPGDFFVNEGNAPVSLDEETQRLKVSYNAVHFTDYGIASLGIDKPVDAPQVIDSEPGELGSSRSFEYRIRYRENGQLIASGVAVGESPESVLEQLKGQVPDLPAELVLEIYENGFLIVDKVFGAEEVISISATDVQENDNPLDVLNFNLETKCTDGLFRYSGPIQYRPSGSLRWLQFSNSVDGLLTTQLLEWGKTYDFRVTYKGQSFERTKAVVQAHFRENGLGEYDYWGPDAANKKVFFTAPIGCQ